MKSITKEEFLEWKEHPVTKEIYKDLEEIKRDLEVSLGAGESLSYHSSQTQGMTNRIVGQIAGLNQILNLYYEDEEKSDEE